MVDFGEILTAAVGERVQTVRQRGDGGWAIATAGFIIHARRLDISGGKPIDGRTIVASVRGADLSSWVLVLDDDTVVDLHIVEAVKRGLTPVEGMPVVKRGDGES